MGSESDGNAIEGEREMAENDSDLNSIEELMKKAATPQVPKGTGTLSED